MVTHDDEKRSADAAVTVQAQSEIAQYLEVSQEQHLLFPRAALVGISAGVAAVFFRGLLLGADVLRTSLVNWSQAFPLVGWIFPILFSAGGATAAVILVRHFAPETSGSGIPHLKAVLHRLRELTWLRVLTVKMIGGVLAIGSGLALGREGPTVQMGGAIGAGVAQKLGLNQRDCLTLTAAGAGAGLAAAFNAPLSGLIFVLEEMQRDFRPAVFGAAFIAAASADVITRLASGQLPVFSAPDFPVPPLTVLPVFALLGCVAGAFGVLFNRGLLRNLDWMSSFRPQFVLPISASVGALCGLIAWFSQIAIGSGHILAEAVLAGNISLTAIPLWFLLRFALTVFSYGTGAAGGIFAPLLVLGALIGLAIGHLAHWFIPAAVPQAGVFAVVGMAAYFTAIVRAPLTGVVLIIEMTGNYEQMLPLLASCFCAYAVAEYLKDVPVYEALLERDLRKNALSDPATPIVVEFEIAPGAPFVGLHVRELGLPPGCILVRCYEDGQEIIPTAATVLTPHMRITAMIAPEATGSLQQLRNGCSVTAHEDA